jgi:hypothetical protein
MQQAEELESHRRYKMFEEKHHWHTMKKLSDDYDRTKGGNKGKSFHQLKNAQKNANFTMRYGISIEGKIETDAPLVVTRKGKKVDKTESTSAGAITIQRENVKKKFLDIKAELRTKYKLEHEKGEEENGLNGIAAEFEHKHSVFIATLGNLKAPKKDKKAKRVNREDDTLDDDIKLFFEEYLAKIYMKLIKCLSLAVKQTKDEVERSQYVTRAMLIVKKLTRLRLEEKEKAKVGKFLKELGYYSLVHQLGLGDKDVQGERRCSFARFQLQVGI